MLRHLSKTYWQTVNAAHDIFGMSREFWRCAAALPALGALNHLGLALDKVFFPRYRSTAVSSPLFIMGHPRSGTTLLHRTLAGHPDAVSFQAWELFVPSLTWRRLCRRHFAKRSEPLLDAKAGHTVCWNDIEEEEFLFMHLLDTQMATFMLPLGFSRGSMECIGSDDDFPRALGAARFLKGCLQRQVTQTGQGRVTARMNYSILRMRALRSVFPDARFVIVYRDPVDAISSHLSLHKRLIDERWGNDSIPKDAWERYVQRRYEWSCAMYRRMAEEVGETGNDNLAVVSYDDLVGNLEKTVAKVAEFADMKKDKKFEGVVKEVAARQSGYRAKHVNLPLSSLGLSTDRVETDLEDALRVVRGIS